MATDILSPLRLEAYSLRRFALDVVGEPDGESHEASVSLSYDFYGHETEKDRFRVVLKVGVRGGSDDSPIFTLDVAADAFVKLPSDVSNENQTVLLTNAVALLYGTVRGSVASVLGQTPIRGFVLPSIDMNKVVRAVATADEESTADEV